MSKSTYSNDLEDSEYSEEEEDYTNYKLTASRGLTPRGSDATQPKYLDYIAQSMRYRTQSLEDRISSTISPSSKSSNRNLPKSAAAQHDFQETQKQIARREEQISVLQKQLNGCRRQAAYISQSYARSNQTVSEQKDTIDQITRENKTLKHAQELITVNQTLSKEVTGLREESDNLRKIIHEKCELIFNQEKKIRDLENRIGDQEYEHRKQIRTLKDSLKQIKRLLDSHPRLVPSEIEYNEFVEPGSCSLAQSGTIIEFSNSDMSKEPIEKDKTDTLERKVLELQRELVSRSEKIKSLEKELQRDQTKAGLEAEIKNIQSENLSLQMKLVQLEDEKADIMEQFSLKLKEVQQDALQLSQLHKSQMQALLDQKKNDLEISKPTGVESYSNEPPKTVDSQTDSHCIQNNESQTERDGEDISVQTETVKSKNNETQTHEEKHPVHVINRAGAKVNMIPKRAEIPQRKIQLPKPVSEKMVPNPDQNKEKNIQEQEKVVNRRPNSITKKPVARKQSTAIKIDSKTRAVTILTNIIFTVLAALFVFWIFK